MATELRWILLGLSCLLLAGIWWWGSRRAGQAAGNAELRESTAGKLPESPSSPDPYLVESAIENADFEPEPRDWGVSPFEPLSIRTADYDRVPVLDGPMMVHADPMDMGDFEPLPEKERATAPASSSASGPESIAVPDASANRAAAVPASASAPRPVRAAPTLNSVSDNSDRFAPPPQAPNAAELQKIVTIRVCGAGESRWSGAQLMAALESHGLSFGRYQVFHRKHSDGRSLFCVASLIEPGTFDIAAMPEEQFRGVTLFAVLPGPIDPLDTIDELFATARGLAEELSAMVQDGKGMPLSPQRAGALREDVARFQAQLPKD